MADPIFRAPPDPKPGQPRTVMLIPGFLAGDTSLTVLAAWLRRRGHAVSGSGIRINTGCGGRELARLEALLETLDTPVILIGQSRGGTFARALAARHPDAIDAVVMLGSPIRDPLAVSQGVLNTVRAVARLGDFGVPGLFSSECLDGACCAEFRALLEAPLDPRVRGLALYSRSDGIVNWRACLDPAAECIEVEGSHCGMGVNPHVYRELERLLGAIGGGAMQSMSPQDAMFHHVENDEPPCSTSRRFLSLGPRS
jgi:pimeloyl-ACP methyl ester carboxylesterase